MQEHFYKNIDGFFTFPGFYAWVAEQMAARSTPHLVEVGVYAGQSAAFLGVELLNRGVKAKLDLVDLFVDGGSADTVLDRLKPVASVIGRASVGCSWEVASLYEDASIDFCFIDANHSYESVARDIDAWRPKVKSGGILAGHDYTDWPGYGVMRAVNERFSRFEIWPGIGGDQPPGHLWPSWSVHLQNQGAGMSIDRVSHDPNYHWRIRLLADAIHEVLGAHEAIDIGCGEGMMTARLAEHGWKIRGADGSLEAVMNHVPGVEVDLYDLSKPNNPAGQHDCVICTETAEHIPEGFADNVVANVAASGRVFMVWSAAKPGQLYPGHINLQPLEYWLEKLRGHGWMLDASKTAHLRERMVTLWAQHCSANDNFCVLVRGEPAPEG